ncbi:MAG: hypothetical protein H8D34_15050 [Chloroflexi bacterium]|nr:hypothetical protein [Chloroflexota bacterium]
MDNKRIEIELHKTSRLELEDIMFDYYNHEYSPYYPIHILSDWIQLRKSGPNYIQVQRSRIRIGLAQDKDEGSITLANISIRAYPERAVLFIEIIDSQNRNELILLIKDIIEKINAKLGNRIASITPNEFEPDQKSTRRKPGMRDRRIQRANLFREIKSSNLELSYEGVASKANRVEIKNISDEISKDNPNLKHKDIEFKAQERFNEKWGKALFHDYDVRNDYLKMVWFWQRADKTN